MKKGSGKSKGSAYERFICKYLSKWVSNNETDAIFWRSAMSGGRATLQLKKGISVSTQSSDISMIHPQGQYFLDAFTVECKHYKTLEVQNLVFDAKGGIIKFWEQVRSDAKAHKKRPMLLARQNHKKDLVGVDTAGLKEFTQGKKLSKLNLMQRVFCPRLDLHLFYLDAFFGTFNPECLKPEVKVP